MKSIKLFVIATLLCGAVSTAHAAVSRQRFSCKIQQGEAVQGYTSIQLQGFIYPDGQQVNMDYSLTGSDGMTTARGQVKTGYSVLNETITVLIPGADGLTSKLAISEKLFSLPFAEVSGDFGGFKLSCSLYFSHFQAASLPQKEFNKFNLPVTHQGLLPVKTWTSSDGVFKIEASLMEDYTNKHGALVKGWSDLDVAFLGAVVDEAEDVPQYMGYLQYGEEKRTLRATLTNLADVKKVISIFKSDKISLNLFHPYGVTSPVNLQIDCTSGRICVITSQN